MRNLELTEREVERLIEKIDFGNEEDLVIYEKLKKIRAKKVELPEHLKKSVREYKERSYSIEEISCEEIFKQQEAQKKARS